MLVFSEVINGMQIVGNMIMLPNKNQISHDRDNGWVLEQFEYIEVNNGKSVNMFSVFYSFDILEDAIIYGKRLNAHTREKIINELLERKRYV